ncbi:hypothetical protein Zmor_009143 [Zophobas morio]|uniref:Uncharacterized protein n=1 Tax=Zophobas morio TaxID=2755281 RepID=A0AA38IIF0_9CUCU|nr:hypothetical protein Zmor_009143 [Zophobas morio]
MSSETDTGPLLMGRSHRISGTCGSSAASSCSWKYRLCSVKVSFSIVQVRRFRLHGLVGRMRTYFTCSIECSRTRRCRATQATANVVVGMFVHGTQLVNRTFKRFVRATQHATRTWGIPWGTSMSSQSFPKLSAVVL